MADARRVGAWPREFVFGLGSRNSDGDTAGVSGEHWRAAGGARNYRRRIGRDREFRETGWRMDRGPAPVAQTVGGRRVRHYWIFDFRLRAGEFLAGDSGYALAGLGGAGEQPFAQRVASGCSGAGTTGPRVRIRAGARYDWRGAGAAVRDAAAERAEPAGGPSVRDSGSSGPFGGHAAGAEFCFELRPASKNVLALSHWGFRARDWRLRADFADFARGTNTDAAIWIRAGIGDCGGALHFF